jgi:hypothetical protein
MNKCSVQVATYPDEGAHAEIVVLESHWTFADRVVLALPNKGGSHVFIISDLEMALSAIRSAKP